MCTKMTVAAIALLSTGVASAGPNQAGDNRFGYWKEKYAGEEAPATSMSQTIEEVLDQVVPEGSCWTIEVDERLKGAPVTLVVPSESWLETLDQLAHRGNFSAAVDDARCTVSVYEGPPVGLIGQAAGLLTKRGRNYGSQPLGPVEFDPAQPEDPVAAVGEAIDGAVAAVAPDFNDAKQSGYSREELLRETVGLHVRGSTLHNLFASMFPNSWSIDLQVPNEVSSSLVDFTFEGTRGDALAAVQKTFRVAVLPYPSLGVVVVTESKP